VNKGRRYLYIGLGLLLTGIGILGIVTPVLPTTVFLLMAGGLFVKASPSLHSWLHGNRITGPFLKAYIDGAGLSRRRKAGTIVFLWVTLLISAWFVREMWWVLIILGSVGIGVTWHVATLKSKMETVE
jgi:uncharacterized membrane protein YbaN (DUF454 family)